MSSLVFVGDSLAVITPYNREFVDALKRCIPYDDRRWDGANKRWLVASTRADQVVALVERYYGEIISAPPLPAPAAPVTVMKQVMYIGRAKERSPGVWTASGYADNAWSLSFPEAVLREYFNDPESTAAEPAQPDSLYKALGLKAFESDPAAIKQAYKRMART